MHLPPDQHPLGWALVGLKYDCRPNKPTSCNRSKTRTGSAAKTNSIYSTHLKRFLLGKLFSPFCKDSPSLCHGAQGIAPQDSWSLVRNPLQHRLERATLHAFHCTILYLLGASVSVPQPERVWQEVDLARPWIGIRISYLSTIVRNCCIMYWCTLPLQMYARNFSADNLLAKLVFGCLQAVSCSRPARTQPLEHRFQVHTTLLLVREKGTL